jgi:hypothetical protein
VRANHCIPMDNRIFYFEVEILECGKNRQDPSLALVRYISYTTRTDLPIHPALLPLAFPQSAPN